MKKAAILIAAILLAAAALVGCGEDLAISEAQEPCREEETLYNNEVEIFVLAQYGYNADFSGFNLGLYFGDVPNAQRAAEIAEEVWIGKYGAGVVKWRPYTVQYNHEKKMWHVMSRNDIDMLGGVFHAVSDEKTGEILDYYVEE